MISFLEKFKYAIVGIVTGLKEDRSIRIQFLFGLLAVIASYFFITTMIGWIILFATITLVIAFEYLNSAIEEIVNFISPDYHKVAKKIKDLSAGAVLIVSIFALFVGICIIGGVL